MKYQHLVNYPVVVDTDEEMNDNQIIEKADHIFETSTIKPVIESNKEHFIVDFFDANMPSIVSDEEGFMLTFDNYQLAKEYSDSHCQAGQCYPCD